MNAPENITARFDKLNNLVLVEATEGEVTTANVRHAINLALELSRKNTCNFLLFDISKMREAQPLLHGFLDMQDMGKTFGLTPFHVCAIVYNPANYPAERAQFIENVVVNRPNPLFKMCASKADAVKWLDTKRVDVRSEA